MILVKKIAQRIFSVGFKVRGSINYMNVVGCEGLIYVSWQLPR